MKDEFAASLFMEDRKRILATLRRIRKERKIKSRQAAVDLGYHYTSFTRMESGRRDYFSMKFLYRYANYLGVDIIMEVRENATQATCSQTEMQGVSG